MVQLARDLKTELQRNNLASFGEILREGWELKNSLTAEISNEQIKDGTRLVFGRAPRVESCWARAAAAS